jgi:hypothetical protein
VLETRCFFPLLSGRIEVASALLVESLKSRDPAPNAVDAQMPLRGLEAIDLCGGCGESELREPTSVLAMRLARAAAATPSPCCSSLLAL